MVQWCKIYEKRWGNKTRGHTTGFFPLGASSIQNTNWTDGNWIMRMSHQNHRFFLRVADLQELNTDKKEWLENCLFQSFEALHICWTLQCFLTNCWLNTPKGFVLKQNKYQANTEICIKDNSAQYHTPKKKISKRKTELVLKDNLALFWVNSLSCVWV